MTSVPFEQVCKHLSLLNGIVESIVRMNAVRAEAWHQSSTAGRRDWDARLDRKRRLNIKTLRVIKR